VPCKILHARLRTHILGEQKEESSLAVGDGPNVRQILDPVATFSQTYSVVTDSIIQTSSTTKRHIQLHKENMSLPTQLPPLFQESTTQSACTIKNEECLDPSPFVRHHTMTTKKSNQHDDANGCHRSSSHTNYPCVGKDSNHHKYQGELIGYNRPPAMFPKTWTPLKSDYDTNGWGGITLKKTPNGRRVQGGIDLQSPISPKKKQSMFESCYKKNE
jgi:hypothetical protein